MRHEYIKVPANFMSWGLDDWYEIGKPLVKNFGMAAYHNSQVIYKLDFSTRYLNGITPDEFSKKILDKYPHMFLLARDLADKKDDFGISIFGDHDSILQTNYYYLSSIRHTYSKIYVTLATFSTSLQYINYIYELMEKYTLKDEKNIGNEIFILKSDSNGVNLISVGTAQTKYIPDNYSSIVQEKYNHLAEDILSSNPCGRLSILSGEPGTGKTFLVKSLLSSEINVSFVIVKPDAIESISDPASVPALISHHSNYDRPIILVLEDADSCLTERMSDNMSRLSAILNTSDGILGSTLDIRIIATTNANKVDFDSAVLRPGRLCTHITTDRLTEEQVDKIFMREIGKTRIEALIDIQSKSPEAGLGFGPRTNKAPGYTLAEIYKAIYTYNKSK